MWGLLLIIVLIIVIIIVVIAISYLTRTSGFIPDPSYTITRNKDNSYKGKRILINFGNHKERKDQWISSQTGLQHGFDEIRAYSISDLDSNFITRNIDTLAYGSWKPYIILKTLESCSEDDIVFYANSNTYFRKSIDPLLDYMNQPEYHDMLLFDDRSYHKEYKYTKRDVFIALDHDNDAANSIQRLSSYSAWRNTERTRMFVSEWLKYCENKQLISNSANIQGKPNHIRFKKHSGDRSILSVLSKKYEIKSLPFRTVKNYVVGRSVVNGMR